MGTGCWYYIFALRSTGNALWMVYGKVDLSDAESCAMWFEAGACLSPAGAMVGLLAEYLGRLD